MLLGNRARHGVGGSEREGAENCGSLRREQERTQVEGGMKRLKDKNRNPGLEREEEKGG